MLVFPANERQATCALVSSGLSNDWEAAEPNPGGVSGLGFELRFELNECARWGIVILLRLMAWQLLVHAGALADPPLRADAVLPLDGPLVPGSQLTHLLIRRSPEWPASLELDSGRFDLLLLTGITEREAALARSSGTERLAAVLGSGVTDPSRTSAV